MIIRPETENDFDAIAKITADAFAPKPYSQGTEPAVIDAVRASADLTLSLVAEEDGVLLGQITFTPVTIDGVHKGWFGLGPVAVRPNRQSEGIGGALIREGLERSKQIKAAGCVLVGDPAYYGRFGFQNDCGLLYAGLDAHVIQKLVLTGPDKTGTLAYCASFERAAAGA